MQPLIFDRVMWTGWKRSALPRVAVSLVWLLYVAVYGTALLRQLGASDSP